MFKFLLFLFLLFDQSYGNLKVYITLQDNLFVRISVPKKGVVCSNQSRVERISNALNNIKVSLGT